MEILNEYTSHQLMEILFWAVKCYCYCSQSIKELQFAKNTVNTTEPYDNVVVNLEDEIGNDLGAVSCELDNKVLFIDDCEKNPHHGAYLLVYGYEPTTRTIFYWTTEMLSIFYDQEKIT